MRFSEATSINKSLSNLGRVFEALRRCEKPPYRESKLTFLLKPMLSGDAKCLLLVNVRGEANNIEETLRALNFAQNAMQAAPEKARLHIYKRK
ncbi:UNVERIFIED_CONTAM: hypothetical protein GTU68_026074 [Idotea baltica]|nr:hypothetical protein [Idotea baltica]